MDIEEYTDPRNSEEDDEEENNIIKENKKKARKKSNKSGGFQSMGLSQPVIRGVLKRGYKIPTPIQRKVS